MMHDTNIPAPNFRRAERGAKIMLGYMESLRSDRYDQPVFIFANLLGDLHCFAAYYASTSMPVSTTPSTEAGHER